MIKPRRMEIKVALLGNVSAGKTTVLNAILHNKYGEVAKKRTTAGVNYFYLNVTKDDVSCDTEKEYRLAELIHEEITVDNQNKVRDGHEIMMKEFDIELPEPIVRCGNDTVLVLVDIPGINEAGTENKYKDFVSDNWTSFDCVIVVMDGRHGVNTEDQVFLLHFVKEHLKEKNISVIILFNKIDDPLEEEQAELVKEARKEVQKIFDTPCREKSLQYILEKHKKAEKFESSMTPAFIGVSAGNAFIYRCGYQMTLEKFQKFDRAIIDSFGRSQFGQKTWNSLSIENRIKKVYTLVCDHDQHVEGMQESNFDAFMNVLDMFVGGNDRQKILIQEQVEHSLSSVDLEPFIVGKITKTVRNAYINLSGLGLLDKNGGVESLQRSFWESHKKFEESMFKQFKNSWPKQNVSVLAGPMKELRHYFDLIVEMKWDHEEKMILTKGEAWVCRYFKFLLEKHTEMKLTPVPNFSTYDWFIIFESILLLSCNYYFCELFGQPKTEFVLRSYQSLELTKTLQNNLGICFCCNGKSSFITSCLVGSGYACDNCKRVYVDSIPNYCFRHDWDYECYPLNNMRCIHGCHYEYCLPPKIFPQLQRNYDDNNYVSFEPLELETHKQWAHVQQAKSLSDVNHFGHLPFEFCQLSKCINSSLKE